LARASCSQGAALTSAFKQTVKLFAASVVALCLSAAVVTQAAAQNVTVSESRSLLFGKIAGDVNGAGTVTINPATGAKTVTGYVFDMGQNDRPGKFVVSGPKNAWVIITLPSTAIVARNNGSETMTMRNFTSSPPAGMARLNNKGKLDIFVGATIDVAPGQRKGTYTGTFTISVDRP